jgi:tetratricopeptide (TPR) repeat protein
MHITSRVRILTLIAAGSITAPAVVADDTSPAQAVAPIFDGMGRHHHPITTRSPVAQRYFNQGLTLCYAFNHPEAIRSFRGALAADPNCAMAHWGIAYASGPHVNRPMTREDNDRAWASVQKALVLSTAASGKERAFIDAMSKRYEPEFKEDRLDLDKAFAAAMRQLVGRYPDDLDAQTIFAEALMDTMPWDYWTKDRTPKPETEEALAAIRTVLRHDPDHPGATHYYIHAVEAGPNPEWGLPSADRLRELVPQAGHLLHMPSHIYMRVGQYEDAEHANIRAVQADRSYIQSCAIQGFYPGVYYPHNEHFLWYAKLFQGRSAEALAAARKTAEIAQDNYCGPSKALEAPRFRHLPWLTQARFGQWDQVLAVPQPQATNDFLIDRAMWHFTRGLAWVARGDATAATRELEQLGRLKGSEEAKKLDSPQFPANGVLTVADHWLAGKVAEARGDFTTAIDRLKKAVQAEDELPYMEPAFWPVPTRPALGAALLKGGNAKDAEEIFRADLKQWPRNGWGLLGLEQSLRAQGRTDAAELVRRQFEQAWHRADVRLDVAWF